MLHTETVEGTTLELLRRLQSESMLDSFCLAGEIALALYLGHRKSIDLDLFTPYPMSAKNWSVIPKRSRDGCMIFWKRIR